MLKIKKVFNRLFCKHSWLLHHITGDGNYATDTYKCTKCGKTISFTRRTGVVFADGFDEYEEVTTKELRCHYEL